MNKSSIIAALLILGGCQGAEDKQTVPGTAAQGYEGIGAEETIHFTGTEPFWGGTIRGTSLTYTTPDNQEGLMFEVARFKGQGGLGFSGNLDGRMFDLLITEGRCSDGMSDRTYPLVATLKLDGEVREGCAYSDRRPFEGPEKP